MHSNSPGKNRSNQHRHQHRYQQGHQKKIEEYLEILWHMQERHGTNLKKFLVDQKDDWQPSITEALKKEGYIEETATELKFTGKGYAQAVQLIRSHRLAERLLTDVLNLKLDHAETGACEFEHIVVPEIIDAICTLLGHPKACPHGLPIPPGACCREAKSAIETAIRNITELEIGEQARVAYINTRSNARMHQLTQLGIRPGIEICIHQKFPVFVIRLNQTQIALAEEVAKDILVWEQQETVSE
jgi:DtxR family Mn-dependent transcriptional regulator